jgi:hypothetical protein
VIAGVFPLKRHHELATASPADSSVKPATTQSRLGVSGNLGDSVAVCGRKAKFRGDLKKIIEDGRKIEKFLLSLQS